MIPSSPRLVAFAQSECDLTTPNVRPFLAVANSSQFGDVVANKATNSYENDTFDTHVDSVEPDGADSLRHQVLASLTSRIRQRFFVPCSCELLSEKFRPPKTAISQSVSQFRRGSPALTTPPLTIRRKGVGE